MSLVDAIRRLERLAAPLEPDAATRRAWTERVVRVAEDFLDRLPGAPAYEATEDKGAGLYRSPIGEEPAPLDELLALFREHVERPGLNAASGGHLGYIPGGGLYASALGDYLAAVTNRYAGVFFASPGAVRMENQLLRWMAEAVAGYPETAAGNLTSGGSIGNLVAVVTARDARGLRAADVPRAVVYATGQAHHSIDKALRIAGLGEAVVRRVRVDERHRMDAGALEAAVEADRRAGLRPWLVVASAGTVDTGVVDPLDALADVAARYGLWLHVDGAYGAFFALTEPGRRALGGIERSDSVVMDPHKGLFLPYGSGAVLVRDGSALAAAHHYEADYMQDTAQARDELSPADLSPELSKHFRGLRLWLALRLAGVAPFRAALEEKLLLARYFHREVSRLDRFEVGPPPELSVVTFRFVPRRGDANEANLRLVQEIQRDGRVFLTSTRLGGAVVLRLAVLSFRTHLETIDRALEVLREKAAALDAA